MHARVALAGNPNSGKTTIFNLLVGGREHVGNWPGTTVERKEGLLAGEGWRLVVVDLPGMYSLTPQSLDEKIASEFITLGRPDIVAVVLDASNLERHLGLAIEILEQGQNVIFVLNKMDLAQRHGDVVDISKLSKILNVPVVVTTASEGLGVADLKELLGRQVESLSRLHSPRKEPSRGLSASAVADQEQTSQTERRYAFIKGLVKECCRRQMTLEERLTLSDRIDQVLTHRFLGIPIFLFFMYALFSLVFRVGDPFAHAIEDLFSFWGHKVAASVGAFGWPSWLGSLVADGLFSGVGNVLVFLPYIMLLYFGISFLQQSGYLARAAFIMDRLMHALGLHGKSFIPMLLGFGCNIPGIMATRTLGSTKDRIITILVLPLMSCSARLPVYTLFAAALFTKHQGLVVFSLYLLGIVMAIVMARVFKKVFFKGESTPLIMEFPPYRWPRWGQVVEQMFVQAWYFVRKAGTVILFFAVLAWALASLPLGVEYASEKSLIGQFGKWMAPIFAPAGFGFWQAAVALVFGIMAKEVVIGTLGTLYGVEHEGLSMILPKYFSPLSGYAFLVMTALYIPCIASIVTIRNETNWKWASVAVFYTLLLGWVASTLVYQVGRLFFS